MTPRQRILAVVGALALLGATLSTGLGSGDDHVDTSSVTIHPGPLTANLTWVSLDGQPEGTSVAGQDGYFTLRVLDERGYATGWNVSVSTIGYPGSGGNLGPGQLALWPGAVSIVQGNPNLAGHVTFCVDPLRKSPALVWSVPYLSGDGEYALPLGVTPAMPADHQRHTSYTVIVNIDGIAP